MDLYGRTLYWFTCRANSPNRKVALKCYSGETQLESSMEAKKVSGSVSRTRTFSSTQKTRYNTVLLQSGYRGPETFFSTGYVFTPYRRKDMADLTNLIPEDAGSGKGGRPKSKEIGEPVSVEGKPYTDENDSTDWWEEILSDVAEDEPILEDKSLDELDFQKVVDVVGQVSDYVYLAPVDVRKKLSEHDIYETDWEQYIEYHNDVLLDARVPHYDGDSYTTKEVTTTTSTTDSSGDEEKSGGLHNLV